MNLKDSHNGMEFQNGTNKIELWVISQNGTKSQNEIQSQFKTLVL